MILYITQCLSFCLLFKIFMILLIINVWRNSMQKSKIGKILSIIAITGAFIVVAVLALSFTKVISISVGVIDFLIILGIICFGCLFCFPATQLLEKDKKNVWAYVILGLTAVTCIMWIIFVIIGQNVITALNSGSATANLTSILGYFKAVGIVTLQTLFANLIIINIYHFKKKMIPFQVVMYVSNFIVDLWTTLLLILINVKDDKFDVSKAQFLFEKAGISIFVVALLFSAVASGIIRGRTKRRNRQRAMDDMNDDDTTISTKQVQPEAAPVKEVSVEERIKKLNGLKEQGLITEEEYSARKAKLLE